jgi:hypothetical protein
VDWVHAVRRTVYDLHKTVVIGPWMDDLDSNVRRGMQCSNHDRTQLNRRLTSFASYRFSLMCYGAHNRMRLDPR